MRYLIWHIAILVYYSHAHSMQTNQSFEQEKVVQRINCLHEQIITIQSTIENAFKNNQSKTLKKQLKETPHINRLISVFAYSYQTAYWRDFKAKMTVNVNFIQKDIRSSVQIMRKEQTGDLAGLYCGINLCLLDILDNLEKQKQREFLAFQEDQNKKEKKQVDDEDEIMFQKVRRFVKRQRALFAKQTFNKQKSSSFSSLPNPFKKKEHDEKLPKIVEVIE